MVAKASGSFTTNISPSVVLHHQKIFGIGTFGNQIHWEKNIGSSVISRDGRVKCFKKFKDRVSKEHKCLHV
jgi:hypothetical protein